jgi:predicted O-methyltransferase YrrM
MYLDTCSLLQVQVGYGSLGWYGSLGYEGKSVSVQGRDYHHALSAHAPSRLTFALDGSCQTFRCAVALNGDVSPGCSSAYFSVRTDGVEVACAADVVAGEPPQELCADVTGAQVLELVTQTTRWEYCHTVWLDPCLDETTADMPANTMIDCLGRAEIERLLPLPRAKRCVATVVSPGFARLLDDMLGSLYANGGCHDALLLVFAFDADRECEQVVAKYQGTIIHCRPRARINAMSKAVMYSIAHVVDAEQLLCLDADMLVLGDLRPIFAAIDACPPGSVFACREGNGYGYRNLEHVLCTAYGGQKNDLTRLLVAPDSEGAYPFVVNDGLFAGTRTALLALDGTIRSMPGAAQWIDERNDIWWRNQFVFNLALARLQCGVELDPVYNLQLHVNDVQLSEAGGRLQAVWRDHKVRVLHFSGWGRHKYPNWRGRFASVPDPLVGVGGGDNYTQFLAALRAWVGTRGLASLAWSFYGTEDGKTAYVRDPSTLPLLALVHYLIRANGCVRVLETGTTRGISAACLASAVAHRPNGRAVTFDPFDYSGRAELWASLPETMRACIEPRATGSIEGMTAALEAGESYDAVLLDSIHTEEHVWAEFQLAAQLVCPGGLILIHDVRYANGTVERALRRIEAAGYGVTRLWTAESGICEDDRLGLAIIENRVVRQSELASCLVTPLINNRSISRIFVYGMQSSGASLFTFFLAQMPETVTIIDLWAYFVAPSLQTKSVCVLKAVVSSEIDLEQHLAAFQPDFKILFIRDPVQTYLSLNRKEFRDIGGTPEEKLRTLESVYANKRDLFQAVIRYEDFVQNPKNVAIELNRLGLSIPNDAHKFKRSLDDIAAYNNQYCIWSKNNFGTKWHYGNIHVTGLNPLRPVTSPIEDRSLVEKLSQLCPTVMRLYGSWV